MQTNETIQHIRNQFGYGVAADVRWSITLICVLLFVLALPAAATLKLMDFDTAALMSMILFFWIGPPGLLGLLEIKGI